MEEKDRQSLKELWALFLDDGLNQIIFSSPVNSSGLTKARVRPLYLKGSLVFQLEEFTERQAFHKNLSREEGAALFTALLEQDFCRCELWSEKGWGQALVSKKGKVTVKTKMGGKENAVREAAKDLAGQWKEGLKRQERLSHNRKKAYVLEEGRPVPFLVDLGVMTGEGKIVSSRYDKFRQINRFLEFIQDILPQLSKDKENTIIDFGCGKSYLTFAMYHYLHILKGYPVKIIGLDLKEEVISRCNALKEKYGFSHLTFCHGDIASYGGVSQVDMVVTLHACDTATDYALAKAVGWGAKVILSVPCCQHEWNGQMENRLMEPILKYGLLKERLAALYTDGIRAELLEHMGYRAQVLEFIDMEHTPKNILIRAVKQGKPRENWEEIRAILDFWNVEPALAKLLL